MHIGPWTVTVTQDKIPIYSDSSTSDEEWTFIDASGHGHFFATTSADQYPTLTWVSVPCQMGHGDDCDGDGHWECRLCHESRIAGPSGDC